MHFTLKFKHCHSRKMLFFFFFFSPKENIPVYILIIVFSASDKRQWRKSQNNKILFKQGKT